MISSTQHTPPKQAASPAPVIERGVNNQWLAISFSSGMALEARCIERPIPPALSASGNDLWPWVEGEV